MRVVRASQVEAQESSRLYEVNGRLIARIHFASTKNVLHHFGMLVTVNIDLTA